MQLLGCLLTSQADVFRFIPPHPAEVKEEIATARILAKLWARLVSRKFFEAGGWESFCIFYAKKPGHWQAAKKN